MPPFCPRPECRAHRLPAYGFQRWGFYRRRDDPARIPRFLCKACELTCSRQTFSTTYYLKRRELLVQVAAGLAACSAHRQIARSAHCAKTSVTRMAERLGRHAILLHARSLEHVVALPEPIVHDHFETFVGRQDHALGIGTAVGATTWFVYDLDPAPHRGSGRRPDRIAGKEQATRSSRSYIRSIKRTFEGLIPHLSAGETVTVNADGRTDYRVALRESGLEERVVLKSYPNPERGPKGSQRSPEAIERDHAMFPVDQLHQLLRHSCADHKRETIAFGRRLESIMGRAHLMTVWKNFIKARSERRPDRTTPAMRLGLTDRRWHWEQVLSRRLFPTLSLASPAMLSVYRKRWTPGLPTFEPVHTT
jgi:transposase-like protein